MSRPVEADEARARLVDRPVIVPGSIGNLGPGFDTLALAVQLYLRVTVRRVVADARNTIAWSFTGPALAGENYVERAFRAVATAEALDVPGLEVEVATEIPMRAGLGSSAAATAAGLLLAARLTEGHRPDLLSLGTALEGHADNVVASLLGGIVTCAVGDDGRVAATSEPWPDALRVVVATPAAELATASARAVLPDQVSRKDAVFNLQRALLLVGALRLGRFALLGEALRDRWHQPYRAPLVPGLADALALSDPDLLGVCLSGAGPSVAAFCTANEARVASRLQAIYDGHGLPCTVRVLAAHNRPAEGMA